MVVFGVDLEQHSAEFLTFLEVVLSQLQIGQQLQSFLVLFVDFEALVQHQNGCIDVLLVVVGILRDLEVKICVGYLFILSCASFAPQLLNHQFLQLSGCFDVLPCLFVRAVVIRSLLFDVQFVELNVCVYVLFQPVSGSVFFSKNLGGEQLLGPLEPSELDAQLGKVKHQIRPVEFFNVVFIKFGGFLVVMGQGISSSQISDNPFVVVSFLVCLLIGHCCLLGFIDLDEGVSVDLEVLKGRHCLDYLVVALCVALPALQVLEMDVGQQFATLDEIGGLCLHSLQNAHCFLDVAGFDCNHGICQQHMHLLCSPCELADGLGHNRFAFLGLLVFGVAFGQE